MSFFNKAADKINYGLTGTRYCGPFSSVAGQPVNAFDRACMLHDEHYTQSGRMKYLTSAVGSADKDFLARLSDIPYESMSTKQKYAYNFARGFFSFKRKMTEGKNAITYGPVALTSNSIVPYGLEEKYPISNNKRTYGRISGGSSRIAGYLGSGGHRAKRVRMSKRSVTWAGWRPRRSFRKRRNMKRRYRKYRKRKFRRRRRYGKRRRQSKYSKLLNMLSPRTVIKGQCYQNIVLDDNLAHFVAHNINNAQSIIHGGPSRYIRVMRALYQNATDSDRDNDARNLWEYSSTTYTVHNPNNFPIHVQVMVFKPNMFTKTNSNTDGLVDALENSLNNTDRFIAANVNYASAWPSTKTQPLQPNAADGFGMYDDLAVQTNMYLKHFGSLFFSNFKMLSRKTVIIPPGRHFNTKLVSRYGTVKGEMFDDVGQLGQKARYMMFRFESPVYNTESTSSDTADRECGHPAMDISIRVETTDVARKIISTQPTVVNLNFTTGELQDKAFQGPSGATFSVANIVGNVNALAEGK